MNKLAIAGALIAALMAVQGASAQERVRANERFCLESSEGAGRGGGGGSMHAEPAPCRTADPLVQHVAMPHLRTASTLALSATWPTAPGTTSFAIT